MVAAQPPPQILLELKVRDGCNVFVHSGSEECHVDRSQTRRVEDRIFAEGGFGVHDEFQAVPQAECSTVEDQVLVEFAAVPIRLLSSATGHSLVELRH